MMILPDRSISRTKLLLPVMRREWLPPSTHAPRNRFGHRATERRWHVEARLHDGYVRWRGTFEDREDADAFLWAIACGTLDQQPALWRLPVPMYLPDYGEGARFLFAATVLITSGTSQSRPSDWNATANTVETIGGGGSGSVGASANGNRLCGGSGAEYRKLTNYAAGSTLTYTIGQGGAAVVRSATGNGAGNDGTDTVLDTTALIAKKGLAGTSANSSTPTPPAGGTGGTGGTGNAGGAGGTLANNDAATGGGGAGGPGGAGTAGSTTTGNNQGTSGGPGGGGSGGAGGAGAGNATNSATLLTATDGSAGTDISASAGSGGGGGGTSNAGSGGATAGSGGSYGAAGGAANAKNGGTATSGAGAPGVILITYTPLTTSSGLRGLPMLGM